MRAIQAVRMSPLGQRGIAVREPVAGWLLRVDVVVVVAGAVRVARWEVVEEAEAEEGVVGVEEEAVEEAAGAEAEVEMDEMVWESRLRTDFWRVDFLPGGIIR